MFIKLAELNDSDDYIIVHYHPMGVLRGGWGEILPTISEVKVQGEPKFTRGVQGGRVYGFHKSHVTPIFHYTLEEYLYYVSFNLSIMYNNFESLCGDEFISSVPNLWVVPVSTVGHYKGENREVIFMEGENCISTEGRFNWLSLRQGDNTLVCEGDSNTLTCSNRDNVLVKGKLNRLYCFGEDNVILLDDSYNSVSTMNTTGNVIIVNSHGNSISVVKGSNVVVLLGNKNHVNVIGDYNTVINVGKENILNTCQ